MAATTPAEERQKGKRIIICCDGTGNKFIDDPANEGSNSNVVKLYTALKVDNEQVAYYHPGVGTSGDPTAKSWVARQWTVLKGLAFARGFKDNVLDAYRYLMERYDDGDRVYMFGFSRGAYTVRALAGLLDGYGLLCKGNEGHLEYAWNEYVRQHKDRDQHSVQPNERFKETFSHPNFRVHFMGIWDTVSSIGWIYTPLRLYNVAQNPTIRTGRHAVSIDERRCFYRDNLWIGADDSDLTQRVTAVPKTQQAGGVQEVDGKTQDLLQVWFPGVHSDVGGSYSQDQSTLSNIALEWLIREAQKAEADMPEELCQLVLGKDARPTGNARWDRKIEVLKDLYKEPTDPMVHRSLKGAWWLLELFPHRYYDKDYEQENWRVPLGMWRRIPEGAFIHKSAVEWMRSRGYEPKNLQGGVAALQPISVPTQEDGTVYRYAPTTDNQPLMNKTPVRIGLLVVVTGAQIAAVVLGASMVRRLWRR